VNKIRDFSRGYPRQFWLLFGGMLISAAGGSMVWPFLTIYIRQRFNTPLTTVGLVLSLNSTIGLVTTFVAGPVVDRFGRKGIMASSLFVSSVVFAAMIPADTLLLWILLMVISGAFNPLFRVGSDAMVADLIAPDRRSSAYALLRMSHNVGLAIGPAVGGFIAAISYTWTFSIAAVANLAFTLLILLFVSETLPQAGSKSIRLSTAGGGYGHLLHDRPFLAFCGLYVLAVISSSLMMVLLPVYAKEQFGVGESQYGFIMTTNAAMVVLFQYLVTRITKRLPPLPVLAAGALFYALGAGSVAWGQSFAAFLSSMVVLTIGEMALVPTATTLTANLSPPDMRGRYMGLYGLTWGLGFGIGPMLGGMLNDHLAPVAIWYGGLAIGLTAALGFLLLARLLRQPVYQSE
jgi:MFS family permease